MPAVRLTARFVETVSTARDRDEYRDTAQRGLQLRVTKGGAKTWALRYRRKSDGRLRRVTLGDWPAMSLEEARTLAGEHVTAVKRGADPAAGVAARKEAPTVREIAAEWLGRYAAEHRAGCIAADRSRLARIVLPEIGDMRACDVTKRDLVRVLEHARRLPDARVTRGDSPRRLVAAPNRLHGMLKSLFRWADDAELLGGDNPMRKVVKPIKTERERERVLSPGEIRAVWGVLEHAPARRSQVGAPGGAPTAGNGDARLTRQTALALQIALATAQRIGEVTGARTAAVDLNDTAPVWTIPAEGRGAAKNGDEHRVPLSPLAAALFRAAIELGRNLAGEKPSEWVFPSPTTGGALASKAPQLAVRRSRAAFGSMAPWTPHDLRRTAATLMAEAGVPDTHVPLVLNHRTTRTKSITNRVYNRYKYDREKRDALTLWGKVLANIVAPTAAGNVVSIDKTGRGGAG